MSFILLTCVHAVGVPFLLLVHTDEIKNRNAMCCKHWLIGGKPRRGLYCMFTHKYVFFLKFIFCFNYFPSFGCSFNLMLKYGTLFWIVGRYISLFFKILIIIIGLFDLCIVIIICVCVYTYHNPVLSVELALNPDHWQPYLQCTI